jgi:hypothetical protein
MSLGDNLFEVNWLAVGHSWRHSNRQGMPSEVDRTSDKIDEMYRLAFPALRDYSNWSVIAFFDSGNRNNDSPSLPGRLRRSRNFAAILLCDALSVP